MRCASARPGRRGIGLFEVLVALTLLGGLVAGGMVVRGRLARGAADDAARAQAVRAADRLLHGWWALSATPWRAGVPRAAQGTVEGAVPLRWQTQTRPLILGDQGLRRPAEATGPGARVDRVRLAFWSRGPSPVYAVELLLPAAPRRAVAGALR